MTVKVSKGSSKMGAGCLFLFGLPFFCAGLFSIYAFFAGTVEPADNAWVAAVVGGLFTLVGAGIMFAAVWVVKNEKAERSVREEFPDEPWRWKNGWKDGVIKDSSTGAIVGLTVFAVLWNGISWPALIAVMLDEKGFKEPAAYLVLLFPAIGLILIVSLVYTVLRKQKYGRSFLHLETFPGVIGGNFIGTVKIPASVYPEKGFRIHIGNYQQYTSGSGKNRKTSERLVWEDEVRLKDCKRRNRETEVPISFIIPSNSNPTTLERPGHDSLWRVTVEAETMGIDYKSTFSVPVFVTSESQDGIDPDTERRESDEASPREKGESFRAMCKEVAVDFDRPGHNRLRLHFGAGRKLGKMVGLMIFFLIWTGIIVGMLMSGRVPILFPIVFGFVDIIIFLVLLFAVFGSSTIEVNSRGLEVTKRLFGIGSPKVFSKDAIKSIRPKMSMQSGNKSYYVIQFTMTDGKSFTAGRQTTKQTVKRFIEEIESALSHSSDTF